MLILLTASSFASLTAAVEALTAQGWRTVGDVKHNAQDFSQQMTPID